MDLGCVFLRHDEDLPKIENVHQIRDGSQVHSVHMEGARGGLREERRRLVVSSVDLFSELGFAKLTAGGETATYIDSDGGVLKVITAGTAGPRMLVPADELARKWSGGTWCVL